MDIFMPAFLILLGLAASAFFSGIETGLISLNRMRLYHEVEHKNRRAIILSTFLEKTEKLLGTTLAGTNFFNVLVAVASAILAKRLFGTSFAIDFSTALISAVVVLVIAESVPKSLYRHYPHRLCL